MDLSILYFLFPRLGESRKQLAKGLSLGRGKIFVYKARKALPIADRQVLRVLPAVLSAQPNPGSFDEGLISIQGITADGRKIPFQWCGSTCHGIDYAAQNRADMACLIGIEVTARKDMVVQHIEWVCSTNVGK